MPVPITRTDWRLDTTILQGIRNSDTPQVEVTATAFPAVDHDRLGRASYSWRSSTNVWWPVYPDRLGRPNDAILVNWHRSGAYSRIDSGGDPNYIGGFVAGLDFIFLPSVTREVVSYFLPTIQQIIAGRAWNFPAPLLPAAQNPSAAFTVIAAPNGDGSQAIITPATGSAYWLAVGATFDGPVPGSDEGRFLLSAGALAGFEGLTYSTRTVPAQLVQSSSGQTGEGPGYIEISERRDYVCRRLLDPSQDFLVIEDVVWEIASSSRLGRTGFFELSAVRTYTVSNVIRQPDE